jgi:hypothetical protein
MTVIPVIMQSNEELNDADDRCAKFMGEWLLELKCPFSMVFYGRIKLIYYDQIIFIMALKGHKVSDFVVRITKYTVVQRYLFNRRYWSEILKPKMLHWYTTVFVPRLVWKQMGRLSFGETEVVLRLDAPAGPPLPKPPKVDFDMGDSSDDEDDAVQNASAPANMVAPHAQGPPPRGPSAAAAMYVPSSKKRPHSPTVPPVPSAPQDSQAIRSSIAAALSKKARTAK